MANSAVLSIETVESLLNEKMEIPGYQRPYRWTTESAVTLLVDTFNAYLMQTPEYRMGSVVLHNDNGKLQIVDGQQRLTTLSIIAYCISELSRKYPEIDVECINPKLLNAKYNNLSIYSIVTNYQILLRKLMEKSGKELAQYATYLFKKCTMVRVEVQSEQEAFQFFDSQNSRGRALAPHDLLKSYHLREMREEDEAEVIRIIEKWESIKQKKLERLFFDHLYPLVRWYKNLNGFGYSTKDIKTFKGVKKNNGAHYSVFARAAYLYIDRFNNERMYELTSAKRINQFQLTQPILSGRWFFAYCLHYLSLKDQIENMLKLKFCSVEDKDYLPENGSGDGYIKNLFINAVMFFVDRFSLEDLTDSRLETLYKWAYSLRLVMKAVYRETVNRYAIGDSNRINQSIKLFFLMSNMEEPSEMDTILLDPVSGVKVNQNKYKCIIDHLVEGRPL